MVATRSQSRRPQLGSTQLTSQQCPWVCSPAHRQGRDPRGAIAHFQLPPCASGLPHNPCPSGRRRQGVDEPRTSGSYSPPAPREPLATAATSITSTSGELGLGITITSHQLSSRRAVILGAARSAQVSGPVRPGSAEASAARPGAPRCHLPIPALRRPALVRSPARARRGRRRGRTGCHARDM